MNRFSERLAITPEKMVQLDDMDDELRNRLWNVIREHWLFLSEDRQIQLYKLAWDVFFKRSVDEIEHKEHNRYAVIRESFFKFPWNRVYDFVESTCRFFKSWPEDYGLFEESQVNRLMSDVNFILESERSGYRFVGKNIVEIASPEGMDAVENALISPDTVAAHIQQALELFSSRNNPNYRNAISEAISAVEAMCRLITGDSKATLGKALKELEKRNVINVHPALNEAFKKIYGYTSDADGIRHAMSELPSVGVEDAQFMIVACSTFVNYLRAKAVKASIALEEAPIEEVFSPN